MSKITINKKSNYTTIDNNIFRNKNLSLKARGLLTTMLSLPDEWDYTVNYTVSSLPSGDGWYFKSVTCNVAVYKTWFFYTWATYGTISFTDATHSLSPKNYPTSITVNVSLEFSIVTEATGISPIVYSESHTATTSISNIVIPS